MSFLYSPSSGKDFLLKRPTWILGFGKKRKKWRKARRHFVFVITIFMTNKKTELSSSSLSTHTSFVSFAHPPLPTTSHPSRRLPTPPFRLRQPTVQKGTKNKTGWLMTNDVLCVFFTTNKKVKQREMEPLLSPTPPHVLFLFLHVKNNKYHSTSRTLSLFLQWVRRCLFRKTSSCILPLQSVKRQSTPGAAHVLNFPSIFPAVNRTQETCNNKTAHYCCYHHVFLKKSHFFPSPPSH